jgi:hypothetical protein
MPEMKNDSSRLTPHGDAVQFAKDYLALKVTIAKGDEVVKVCRALVALSERGRIEMPSQGEILLACGELKASELRAVKAVLAWFIGRLNG